MEHSLLCPELHFHTFKMLRVLLIRSPVTSHIPTVDLLLLFLDAFDLLAAPSLSLDVHSSFGLKIYALHFWFFSKV